MKWTLPKNSLFAILLRSPWWKSLGVAVLLSLIAYALLPERLKLAGALASMPFVIIGLIAAWRQLKQPSERAIEQTQSSLRSMDWPAFSTALEAALHKGGHIVERSDRSGMDFQTFKDGRRAAIVARRWKSAQVGVDGLRALRELADEADCQDAIYVSLGVPSEAAGRFAQSERVKISGPAELAALRVVA